eukprot:5907966-Amphidinium_carterae.2
MERHTNVGMKRVSNQRAKEKARKADRLSARSVSHSVSALRQRKESERIQFTAPKAKAKERASHQSLAGHVAEQVTRQINAGGRDLYISLMQQTQSSLQCRWSQLLTLEGENRDMLYLVPLVWTSRTSRGAATLKRHCLGEGTFLLGAIPRVSLLRNISKADGPSWKVGVVNLALVHWHSMWRLRHIQLQTSRSLISLCGDWLHAPVEVDSL